MVAYMLGYLRTEVSFGIVKGAGYALLFGLAAIVSLRIAEKHFHLLFGKIVSGGAFLSETKINFPW